MKKIIFGILSIGLIGLGIVGCKKEQPHNPSSSERIVSDINAIYNHNKNSTFYEKSLGYDFIKNQNNPFDYVGQKHNETLDILFSYGEANEKNFCFNFESFHREYLPSISLDCETIIAEGHRFLIKTYDDKYTPNYYLLKELQQKNEISELELQLISVTFDNAFRGNTLIEKINFLKSVEDYISHSDDLKKTEKERILRTMAIYRYSSYYWEIERKIEVQGLSRPSDFISQADALGEHWAMNSLDSPAQDGSDIYRISSEFSFTIAIWIGILGWY